MALPTLKVMGDSTLRDQHINWILTGKMDYYADRLPGRKLYGAIKTSTIARGWIKLASGGGAITGFTVTAGGTGYTSAPTVTIAGGSGNGATATATVTDGKVTAVTIVSGGSNYSSAPRVTFSGGAGTGAAATAIVSNRSTPMIDATKALALPGVRAVVTYVDVPTWTQGIFQWGQEVAGVVADDYFTAVRACQLIDVTYETADTVWDVEAAMKSGSPLAIPGGNATTGTNVGPATTVTRGDITAGFAAADVTITREQPWTVTYQHNMLEPHGCVAWWIGDDAYFWFGSQDVHSGKNAVVNATGLPANKIHAYTHGTGGGHGDKTGSPAATPAIYMSQKVGGIPVQLVEQRNVNMTVNTRQFDTKQSIKVGAKTDGTIVAYDATGYTNTGRSGSFALAMAGIQNSFTIPNYRHNLYSVNTNAPVRGAWRCVGDPPASLGYDSALDTLAAKLNMDPYALRIKNVRDATLPAQDGTKLVWGGTAIPLILKTLYTESGYASKWHAPGAKTMADGRMHGIALNAHIDSHGSVSGASRYMSMVMTSDGKALVNIGGARGSEGAETTMCIFVAEAMGLTYADVRCGEWGNTDTTLTAGIQAGSGFTAGAGSAAVNMGNIARVEIFKNVLTKAPFSTTTASGVTKATATATVKDGQVIGVTITNPGAGYTGAPMVSFTAVNGGSQAMAVANVIDGKVVSISVTNPGAGYVAAPTVAVSGLSINDLDAKDSVIFLKSDPTVTITYRNAVSGVAPLAWTSNGWAAVLRSHAVGAQAIGTACNTNGDSGACAEIAVDIETGEIEVLGLWNCVDTGRTVYKKGMIKEMLSGCELIIAQTLFYGDVYDPATGACISSQYTEAQVPTAMDMKGEVMNVYDVESDDAAGPFGAHGVGEPCSSNVASIYCAIYNAIGVFPDPDHGAMNPDKILKALGKA